jgi:phosphate transport system permease protein
VIRADSTSPVARSTGRLPEGAAVHRNVSARQRVGAIWQGLLLTCTMVSIVILLLLLYNIANDAFGGIAVQQEVPTSEIYSNRQPSDLSQEDLIGILTQRLRSRVLHNLEHERPLAERTPADLIAIIDAEVIKPELVAIYPLREYLLNRSEITAQLRQDFPRAEIQFKSWLSGSFITSPMSSDAQGAGVRTAILGTLWMLGLTILFAFPLGIGAALYLEEYTSDRPFDVRSPLGRWLNSATDRLSALIAINIYNLSGVPSIIYGILGLAIFVRALEPITSGQAFGQVADETANGRTIIAAALTMALLVLPVVIISAQEAIRAVPNSLRQASYGLGATRWQTIWRIVLPSAMPGILTGAILAISRAIGETAPLIVIGASTFIVTDPSGPFAKFTVLPIQIYNWTARPQGEFRAIAAAAIIVLLIILLSMNATAIILRNYLRSKRVS